MIEPKTVTSPLSPSFFLVLIIHTHRFDFIRSHLPTKKPNKDPTFPSTDPTMMSSNVPVDTECVLDTVEAMRRQEETGYRTHDYLHQQVPVEPSINQPQQATLLGAPVDAECRFRMTEWCYQIVDFCKFKRETVAVSMSYLDRFLASTAGREILLDRSKFQLAAMAALYTAIKIHEPEAMEPGLIASLSRGAYNKEQIEAMEFAMLNAIQWRVNPPTAISFVHLYLDLIPNTVIHQEARDAIIDLAKYQTELAVSDHAFIPVNASFIALAAILNALESMGMDMTLLCSIESGTSSCCQDRHRIQSNSRHPDPSIRSYHKATGQRTNVPANGTKMWRTGRKLHEMPNFGTCIPTIYLRNCMLGHAKREDELKFCISFSWRKGNNTQYNVHTI